ncbi:endoribonuclease YbeY [Caldalkalibacillus thermarum]|uniref:rRNA maturation RNase YbeY n=1 Tax=Caldalkalibacillus thermarum TaxID=296745 RepID=UPI00166977B8|nr:rRNA maturation RNase YbeY [Caldalkalibacillus thermarum]GGK18622.1 endoribonuclease YbeY [Caldalkalibacillus thermarum]
MIKVQIQDNHALLEEQHVRLLEELIATAARILNLGEGEVSVTLVNDEEIRELNRQYRNKDRPTDVLSFPMYEAEEWPHVLKTGEYLMLGDIIISVPRARAQAEELGHSFERELGFLLVHGLLHLVGYDHQDEESAQRMFQKQEDILSAHRLFR